MKHLTLKLIVVCVSIVIAGICYKCISSYHHNYAGDILYQLRQVKENTNCFNLTKVLGKKYADNVEILKNELNAYDSYIDILLSGKSPRDKVVCMEGHVGKYIEEAYVLWELAKLDKVKVICETGKFQVLFLLDEAYVKFLHIVFLLYNFFCIFISADLSVS